MDNKYLPSTYIKYWWHWKRLNTQSITDELFLMLAMTIITTEVIKTLNEEEQAN